MTPSGGRSPAEPHPGWGYPGVNATIRATVAEIATRPLGPVESRCGRLFVVVNLDTSVAFHGPERARPPAVVRRDRSRGPRHRSRAVTSSSSRETTCVSPFSTDACRVLAPPRPPVRTRRHAPPARCAEKSRGPRRCRRARSPRSREDRRSSVRSTHATLMPKPASSP